MFLFFGLSGLEVRKFFALLTAKSLKVERRLRTTLKPRPLSPLVGDEPDNGLSGLVAELKLLLRTSGEPKGDETLRTRELIFGESVGRSKFGSGVKTSSDIAERLRPRLEPSDEMSDSWRRRRRGVNAMFESKYKLKAWPKCQPAGKLFITHARPYLTSLEKSCQGEFMAFDEKVVSEVGFEPTPPIGDQNTRHAGTAQADA